MADQSQKDQYATSLKKAKGLGSGHHGVDHWMMQKITALANLPLILWFIWSITSLHGASHAEFTAWVAAPFNAILLIALIISVCYHAKLGAQVITEDYVSCKALRTTKIIAQKLFFFGIALVSIFSVLKIAFTAGV